MKKWKKKLDDICRQRDYDKQYLLRREEEYVKELEQTKKQQLKSEMEKEDIRKEKELVKKEKEEIKKEKEELLLLQQKQKQKQSNLNSNYENTNTNTNKNLNEWKCPMCYLNNKEFNKSCQRCTWNRDNGDWLTIQGIVNDNAWKPCIEQI